MSLSINKNKQNTISNQKKANQSANFAGSTHCPNYDKAEFSTSSKIEKGLVTTAIIGFATGIAGVIYGVIKHKENTEIIKNLSENLQKIGFPTFVLEKPLAMIKKLFDLATKDSLTGLYNRRYFYIHLKKEIKEAGTKGENLIVGMFDNDYFKSVNEALDHAGGDTFLKAVGGILKDTFGEESVARYGGEEFSLKLKGKSTEEARQMFKEYQGKLKTNPILQELVPKYLDSLQLKIAALESKSTLTTEDKKLLDSCRIWHAHVKNSEGFTTSIGFVNIKNHHEIFKNETEPEQYFIKLADTALCRTKGGNNTRNSVTEVTEDDLQKLKIEELKLKTTT